MKRFYLLQAFLLLVLKAGAQVLGCTDPLSSNYNPLATVNDGSCLYPQATVSPSVTVNLPEVLSETSGLIVWNGGVYTHNDDTDTHLYRLDTNNADITQTLTVTNAVNQDWEDLSQDDAYVYIGDFGNNVSGNRTNLRIIRVAKAGLLAGTPVAEYINFTYSDQSDFAPTGNNNTNFDCEAMLVGSECIFLFTKQWVSKQTSVYRLPKTPGNHTAQLLTTYNVNGLVTGAAWQENKRVIALTGYTGTLTPFVYLLYDYSGMAFFSGNKRKLNFPGAFVQLEAVATADGLNYYFSNEHFQRAPFINSAARLYTADLSAYLQSYLATAGTVNELGYGAFLYPNPSRTELYIQTPEIFTGAQYVVIDALGKEVLTGTITGATTAVDVSLISTGMYTVRIKGQSEANLRLIKQ